MPIYAPTPQAQGVTSRRSKEPSELQKNRASIPKVAMTMSKNAHFAWDGPPITQMALYNILNFQRLNPDYRVTIWTSRPLSIFSTLDKMMIDKLPEASYRYAAFNIFKKINIEDPDILFDKLPFRLRAIHAREKSGPYKNMAAASDIVRLAALYLRGGVYLDVDVSVTGRMPNLAATRFYIYKRGREVGNGVLACAKGNADCYAILAGIEKYYRENKHVWRDKRSEIFGPVQRLNTTMEATGIHMIAQIVTERRGAGASVPAEAFGARRANMYVLRNILAKRGTVIMEKETIFSLGHVKELNADAKSYSDPGKVRRASF